MPASTARRGRSPRSSRYGHSLLSAEHWKHDCAATSRAIHLINSNQRGRAGNVYFIVAARRSVGRSCMTDFCWEANDSLKLAPLIHWRLIALEKYVYNGLIDGRRRRRRNLFSSNTTNQMQIQITYNTTEPGYRKTRRSTMLATRGCRKLLSAVQAVDSLMHCARPF